MINFERILAAVGSEYGQQRQSLLSDTRGLKGTAWARQVAMYLCWRCSPQPCYSEVGRSFGRDRTTVRHATAKVKAAADPRVKKLEARFVRTTSPL